MHDDQARLMESLSAYLDGALDGAERDALERHLATCETCRAELAELRRVGALLRSLPEPALPRSFTLPVTTTWAGQPAPRRAPAWARAAQWTGGVAAALGVGLLLAGALHAPNEMSGAANAPASQGVFTQRGSTTAPSAPARTPGGAQATEKAGVPTPTNTEFSPRAPTSGAMTGAESQGAGSPLLPAGVTLLVGGGAALAAGTASRRHARRDARASRPL